MSILSLTRLLGTKRAAIVRNHYLQHKGYTEKANTSAVYSTLADGRVIRISFWETKYKLQLKREGQWVTVRSKLYSQSSIVQVYKGRP